MNITLYLFKMEICKNNFSQKREVKNQDAMGTRNPSTKWVLLDKEAGIR
jgi:hypothetical protein